MKQTSSLLAIAAALMFVLPAQAQDEKPLPQILFTNVHVFDGVNEARIENANVLVEGNLIKSVSTDAIEAGDATVIDGGGNTLIPGLIEAHAHLSLHGDLFQIRNDLNWMYMGAKSGAEATHMLMRGFTTARDAAGPVNGLRKVIDAGHVVGPRIYAAGPALSQTGGHFDIRGLSEPNYYFLGTSDPKQFLEYAYLADGVPEVQKAAREIFRKGSSHIKIMAGGGVATVYDPLDGLQFTPEEIRAAVVEAEKVGSYAMAHIYTPEAITIALEAGVKSIDHGMLIDDKAMKLLKEKDAFLVPSLAVGLFTPEELAFAWPTPATKAKGARIIAGMENEVELAKKHGVKIGFGTDFFGPTNAEFAQQSLEFKARAKYFTAVEILKQATSTNAALVAMSGPMMNPYLDGPLGVIQPGAYADILVVKGNPLEDIELLVDPENNIGVIMKDGVIYKNTLDNGASAEAPQEDAKTIGLRLTRDGRMAIYGFFFDADEAGLKAESQPILEAVASVLNEDPNLSLAVVGHTDAKGSHEHNMNLSKQRADTVVSVLVNDYGIDPNRLFAAGAGFLAPVASNATEEGQALNRRVELVRMVSGG